jgi:hypothetical protein
MLSFIPKRHATLWFSSRLRFSTVNTFLGHSSRDINAADTRNTDLRTCLLEELKISLKVRAFFACPIASGF